MTHTILSIEPKPAEGPGCLDGFEYRCSCGDHAGYSIRSMTEDYARRHAEYMNTQEKKFARRWAAKRDADRRAAR